MCNINYNEEILKACLMLTHGYVKHMTIMVKFRREYQQVFLKEIVVFYSNRQGKNLYCQSVRCTLFQHLFENPFYFKVIFCMNMSEFYKFITKEQLLQPSIYPRVSYIFSYLHLIKKNSIILFTLSLPVFDHLFDTYCRLLAMP